MINSLKKLREIAVLGSTNNLLGWDMEVYMPKGEADFRAEQTALISRMGHEIFTSESIGRMLRAASKERLTEPERTVVEEALDDYERARRIPKELVEEISKVTAKGFIVWEKAKHSNDFKSFAPFLKKIIGLEIKSARLSHPELRPYEGMLRTYDRDIGLKQMRELLSETRDGIKPIIRRAKSSDTSFLKRKIPIEAQKAFNMRIAESMGFDFEHGRLDESTHPFTVDARITTRYDQGWHSAIGSTMHEAGHGLYDLGVPREHLGTALGEFVSISMHESQSRIWENHVGQCLPFWKHNFPLLKKAYSPYLKDITLDEFYKAINSVKPTLIRIEADELTYPLHVILRFELEQELVSGKLRVEELPEAWNEKMKQYLGIVPKTNAQGCLQDVHWSQGYLGYFPTYVLGSMMSAQLYNAAKRKMPGLETSLSKGDCKPLLGWLRANVHKQGRRYKTDELLKRATGKTVGSEDYVKYLSGKFLNI